MSSVTPRVVFLTPRRSRRRASPTLLRRKNKLVSVWVLELQKRSPRHFLRRRIKFDAALGEFLIRFLGVVAPERNMRERADVTGVFFRRKEDDGRFGARNAQLDPALISHGLVGENIEAEFLSVKLQGAFLIAHGDGAELNSSNHFRS